MCVPAGLTRVRAACGSAALTNTSAPNADGFVVNLYDSGLAGAVDWVRAVSDPGNERVTAVALQILSRWGQCVFTSNAYQGDWGPEAASGTYYYLLRRTGQPTAV